MSCPKGADQSCSIPAMVQDATYDTLEGVPIGMDIAASYCSSDVSKFSANYHHFSLGHLWQKNQCSNTLSAVENLNHVRVGGSPSGIEIGVQCCSDTLLPGYQQMADSCPTLSRILMECAMIL